MCCESEVTCVERASWWCLEWVSVVQLVGMIGCCRLVNLVVVAADWSTLLLLLQTGQPCCCCRLVNLSADLTGISKLSFSDDDDDQAVEALFAPAIPDEGEISCCCC